MIWVATAVVFFVQARAAYPDEFTVLPPYSTTIPSNFSVQIGDVRFQDVIDGLTTSYNANVAALQASIRASAKLTFDLNLMSGFFALVGLVAQIGQAMKSWREIAGDRHNEATKPGTIPPEAKA